MDNRGGARKGAGRKRLDTDTLRVQLSLSVKAETKLKAQVLRENGVKLGHEVDKLVDRLVLDLENKK